MKYLSLTLPNPNPQGNPIPIKAPGGLPSGGLSSFQNALSVAFGILFLIGIVLGIVILIYSGIQWVSSQGDEKKIQAARGRLIYSIIGIVMVAGAFAIVTIILKLLGANTLFFLGK